MLDKKTLRQELCAVCPKGLYKDMIVGFDKDVEVWRLDFNIHNHHLRTYLEESDVKACTDSHHCLAIGLQIGEIARDLLVH